MPPTRIHAAIWISIAIVVLVAGSLGFNQLLERTLPKPKLPILTTIKGDLDAIERSGQKVKFSDLRGKVTVCAFIYTICPHGCAAVMGEMQKLNREHASRMDFQLVSLALLPERDTPEFLKVFAEGLQVKPSDPWWFLSGDRQRVWDFMTQELKLERAKEIPEDERLNPLDLFEHDLRIVLIDKLGQVRGYYAVFHPQAEIAKLMADKLQRHVTQLLDEPSPPKTHP
jgi:cytochrome oxidase Cu insertion factor (SCO1/SenC/PrrC family)